MKLLNVAAVLGGIAVASVGESAYFYQRTMKRNNAKVERTIKMAGTDWSQYQEMLQTRKKYFLKQPHKDVYIQSKDKLKLHATFFPREDKKKVVSGFHGYTSQGMSDYIGLSD